MPVKLVWTPGKWDRAKELLAEGYLHSVVAAEVGVTTAQLENRINNEKGLRHEKAPREVLADRDRRAAADHPTLTARFCGDPKPGFSALDQLRAKGGA